MTYAARFKATALRLEENYSKNPQSYVRWHTVSLPPWRNQNAVLRFNLGAVTAFPLLRVDNDDARIRFGRVAAELGAQIVKLFCEVWLLRWTYLADCPLSHNASDRNGR